MKRGFSLIELLVTIFIIALLVTVVIAAVQHVQTKSRDTRRMEDMNEISRALELYHTDNYQFPKSGTGPCNEPPGNMCPEVTLDGDTDPLSTTLVAAGAIPAISTDPVHPDYTYRYQTNALGTTYILKFCLETNSIQGYVAGCDNEKRP